MPFYMSRTNTARRGQVTLRVEQYYRVNAALNRHFFSGRFNGRPVYLTIGDAGRELVARDLGIAPDRVASFIISAVKWALDKSGDPYVWVSDCSRRWSVNGFRGAPPMTALLFVLSLAAERMHSDGTFSSANYYQRLDELLGLGRDKLASYGRATEPLWRYLGEWLADSDFEYGRPTARQMNSWRYVGLAMSQAVVTLADRQLFHSLFDRFGFSASDDLTADDMGNYIDEWMLGSAPSQRLRASWSNASLRTRVAEAALAELNEWATGEGGQGDGQDGPRTTRLSLNARLVPSFPTSSLSLSIGVKAELLGPIGPLAARGLDGQAMLANSYSGSFATVSPNVATSALFKGGISLETEDAGQVFTWSPRLVIPFLQSQSGNSWVEVSRASLLVPVMALVRDTSAIVGAVNEYLAAAALPDWNVASPSDLSGIPKGWLLYTSISIIRSGVESKLDVQPLVPLASAAGLVAEGGLKLDRDIWHAHEPPKFKFLFDDGPTSIKLVEGVEGEGKVVMEATSPGKDCILDLSGRESPITGNFTVIAYSGGIPSAQSVLVLRSAAKPRPLDRQRRGFLEYRSLCGASPMDVGADNTSIEGHVVQGLPECVPALPNELGQIVLGSSASAEPEEGDEATQVARFEQVVVSKCVESGFHHWMYDSVRPDDSKDSLVKRECANCKQVAFQRQWRRSRRVPARKDSNTASCKPATQAPRIRQLEGIDHDLLVDAMCFIGSGRWSRFEALAMRSLDHPWQATALAKDLQALGLMDLEFHPGTGRLVSWSVPPPTLSFMPNGRAILTGFRNGSLLKVVKQALEAVGASVAEKQFDTQPSMLEVAGVGPEAASDALKDVKDVHGREVAVVDRAPWVLAEASMCVGGFSKACEPISLGVSRGVEKFDLATARWREVERADEPGAYRTSHAGRTYVAKLADGRAYSAPFEIVKAMAAAISGHRLHAYDPRSKEFSSVIGAEPAGLLARMLVACSGQLPVRAGGLARYPGVPSQVAATVLYLTYDESQLP